MRTKVEEYDGQLVRVSFFPESEAERTVLLSVRNGLPSDSAELNVMDWVNSAMKREGLGPHEILGFEDVFNNVYYVFRVQRSPRGIGY
ncbi:hypothetical protein GCM10011375_40300 [Hymenobacter qilianensis]|uniref:Uncharacterized protein n=1 Tax=Hymenobacter qilianensis TaxID=1385715 RepID=A0ACB5PXF9_9BACT|nr:hypothetical protein GCM10011375_40300 [Hymenobacter qilianensis]